MEKLPVIKELNRKNISESGSHDPYFLPESYHSFDRLAAIRNSHETTWIINDEAMEVLGPKTDDDDMYNPNVYSKFKFRYVPSTPEHNGKLFAKVQDTITGWKSHGLAWEIRTHPISLFIKMWFFYVLLGWIFCMNNTYAEIYLSIFLWIFWIGPLALVTVIFDMAWYDNFLKNKDANTEYYNSGDFKWW